jgi:hypothetical protein
MARALRQDLDFAALAAFKNATGEMTQAEDHGQHVRENLAFGASGPWRRQNSARRGCNVGHWFPLLSGGSTNALCHRQEPLAKR